jgi:N-acetyl-anhydromuramyl-L-alanine amidase AmpD
MNLDKEKLYTIRWEIKHGNIEDALKVIAELLGETSVKPEPEPDRPSPHEPGTKSLWCPLAEVSPTKMATRGNYPDNYPMGAVVHFTAGRSKKGAKDAQATIDYGAKQGYAYFCIASDGTILQAAPLNKWGNHAGSSAYPGLGSSVSSKLVGIEICNAGNLKKLSDGRYKAWFDETYDESEVRESVRKDNITPGIYHKYTEAQEKALIELLVWLKRNNPDAFSFDFVVGHDEVATPKGRKSDPGASLSMTMPKFRALLKEKYNKQIEGT